MLANMFVTALAALLPLVSGQHYLNLVSHNIYTISTQYLHYIYTGMQVSLEEHDKARCNDGTAAVYYRQPLDSPSTGARKLLLYLQGGGFCVPGGCDHRCGLKLETRR